MRLNVGPPVSLPLGRDRSPFCPCRRFRSRQRDPIWNQIPSGPTATLPTAVVGPSETRRLRALERAIPRGSVPHLLGRMFVWGWCGSGKKRKDPGKIPCGCAQAHRLVSGSQIGIEPKIPAGHAHVQFRLLLSPPTQDGGHEGTEHWPCQEGLPRTWNPAPHGLPRLPNLPPPSAKREARVDR